MGCSIFSFFLLFFLLSSIRHRLRHNKMNQVRTHGPKNCAFNLKESSHRRENNSSFQKNARTCPPPLDEFCHHVVITLTSKFEVETVDIIKYDIYQRSFFLLLPPTMYLDGTTVQSVFSLTHFCDKTRLKQSQHFFYSLSIPRSKAINFKVSTEELHMAHIIIPVSLKWSYKNPPHDL